VQTVRSVYDGDSEAEAGRADPLRQVLALRLRHSTGSTFGAPTSIDSS
jgi:hypothetical protein